MADVRPVRRALLAVYDKTGIVEFARALVELGVELVSTGGTAKALQDAGVQVTPVADVTGFPGDARRPGEDAAPQDPRRAARRTGGTPNTSPSWPNTASSRSTSWSSTSTRSARRSRAARDFDDVIEQIDIGGPAMVRAAAKNFASVGVVVEPGRLRRDRGRAASGGRPHVRHAGGLAAGVRAHRGLRRGGRRVVRVRTRRLGSAGVRGARAREGGGPALRREPAPARRALRDEAGGPGVLGGAEVLQGKEMSFNNWLDADAAAELVAALPEGAAVIVKHNNPCGAAAARPPPRPTRRPSTATRCRRSAASSRSTARATARPPRRCARCSPRSSSRRRSATTRWPRSSCVRTSASVRGDAASAADGLDVRPIPGGALVQDARRRHRRPCRNGRSSPAGEPTEDEWKDLVVRLDRRMAREVERDRARARRRDGRDRRRADVARRRVVDRGAQGRRPGPRSRDGERRLLPVPRRHRGRGRRRRHRGRAPRRLQARREVLAAAEARGMAVVLTGRRHFRH